MRKLIYAGAVAVAFMPAIANAYTCWVEKVTSAPSGVRVKMERQAPRLEIRRTGGGFEWYDEEMVDGELTFALRPSGDASVPQAMPDGVVLKVGDLAGASNSPHDACTLTVENRDGVLGLRLRSYFAPHMPPGFERPPSEGDELIVPERQAETISCQQCLSAHCMVGKREPGATESHPER